LEEEGVGAGVVLCRFCKLFNIGELIAESILS